MNDQSDSYADRLRGFGGNLIQKKRKLPPPQPWHCPQCQQPVASYFNQCPRCLQPRTNSYGEA